MTPQDGQALTVAVDTAGSVDDGVYLFPASFGQRRLWFLDRFEPGSPYYNIPLAFRLRGRFDPGAFRRVLQAIVDRHEVLRTTIQEYRGEPVQVIAPRANAAVTEEDLTGLAVDRREETVRTRAIDEARAPFDLANGPLFRTRILHAGDGDTVILMVLHHCIADGWSMAVLMREIIALYEAFTRSLPSPLPPLQIQYADYSEWQHAWLQGETRAQQLAYWTEVLRDAPEVLELPADRTRPAVYTNTGASLSVTLPAALSAEVHALCRQEGATVFMALFAVFTVLLHRITGQDDLCVGTPIANRTHAETEPLIGLFINTIVLRTRFEGEPTFRSLLHSVRETTLGAYAHQDLPLEMLIDALHLDRDMTHPPLFQVMFILQNVPTKVRQLPGVLLEQLDVDMGTSTYELTLMVSESEAGFLLTFEYNTDLFDEATIRRMGEHYRELLGAALRTPDMPVGMLPYLTGEELRTVTRVWNPPAAAREDRCVHDLIARQAAATPEATAVVCGGDRCTYHQLEARAARLARTLHAEGIGQERRVGLALPKSIDLIVAILGVLKAGAAYVPLDPSYPQERLEHMVRDAGLDLLITDGGGGPGVPSAGCRVASIAVILDGHPAGDEEGLVTRGDPDALAYMIYTSGTTGIPKGTMVSHRSLLQAYRGWEEHYELRTGARVHLQMAGFSFDVFSGDLVRALCSGGTLVLCPRDVLLDAEGLYQMMVREGVTIAEFVPAVLRNLLTYFEGERRTLDFLRLLIAGSDVWYVREYDHIRRMLGRSTRLINSYGVTEATIDTTWFEGERAGLSPERLVPIGRPFPGQAVYILDRRMNPVGIGLPGELYIGGAGVARGYHGRPGLTAERFVPDPVSGQSGARLYRTGDVGRFLPDGTIEFMGRADHQVKIRGFRIEPGDIEAALARHDAVREAVVVAREDASGSRSLVAYVIPEDRAAIDGAALRAFLIEQLPEYMVPSAFVLREAFPLTPNGKVDRKALPAPRDEDRVQAAGYVAPHTPQEIRIAEIWMELLGLERVGVYDDFFQLGGHSLLATQLVARLRAAFGCECPLRTVFESPTVVGLATALAGMGQRVPDGRVRLDRIPRTGRPPLSFAQQRMWFLQHLEPDSPFYIIPEVYRIQGLLEPDTLRDALQMVVRRHEILRTAIREEEGIPWQEVLPELTVDLPVIDLSHLPAEEQDPAVSTVVRREASRPFVLEAPPLFRMTLLRLAGTRHVLVTVFHHCIADNWSTGVLLGDLAAAYEAVHRGLGDPLPPLPLQYADYASWQRACLQGETLAAEVGYWREKLGDVPRSLDLPTDHPRPAVQTFNGDVVPFTLPQPVGRRLRALAQEEHATMFMVLLAAFDVLLHRYTGQPVLAVGTPVANRGAAELEALIGLFVNTLVIRADCGGDPGFRTMVRRIRTHALEAYAHQDVPFEKLVDVLQPERDLARSPLFQVMFVLQNAREQRPSTGAIAIEPVDAHSGTSKFDLTLFMAEQGEDCGGVLEYNTDLFERGTIERMAGHLVRLLDAVAADPDRSIGHLTIPGPLEQRALVHAGRGSRRAMPARPFVHEFIEARSFLCPAAAAVEGAEGVLTHAALRSRSTALAHRLRACGVGPEVRVGIFLPRSHDLVTAVVAVLKAGGAYVPIDAGFPDERIAFMVADASPAVIVTTGSYAARLRSCGVPLFVLDGSDPDTVEQPLAPAMLEPDSLAYVIYTSGSTGRPKGTMLTHRGLMNYIQWCLETYPCEGERTLLHLPLTFDASITALFPPLVGGGTIVLADDRVDGVMPLEELAGSGGGFGTIKLTPAHLEILTHMVPPARRKELARAFVVGGEQFTADQAAPWYECGGTPVFFNEYGPTEAVVGCVVARFDAAMPGSGALPIGRAIPNAAVYVLDAYLHPVPSGVWGELCIAGPGVARGYLGRADMTAAAFLPDPFGRPGDRMYRTGDLVRFLPDGSLEFRGRKDLQVKFHGYRIEPAEVEAVLRTHAAVQDAVVCIKQTPAGEERLIAYFTVREGETADVTSLRERCETQLPRYMVPSAFVPIGNIPLTVHGKVDRAALPFPGSVVPPGHSAPAAPVSSLECALVRIWSEVLGAGTVGIDDNFFALGGDSILVIQVLARAARAGITLTAAQVFQYPTIREQAAVAAAQGAGPALPAGEEETGGETPLTPIQHWFFGLGLEEPSHWNQSIMIPLPERLDPGHCRTIVRLLMERHDVLRTRFTCAEDGWHQQVEAMAGEVTPGIPVEEEDLMACQDGRRLTEEIAARSTRWQKSLDIVRGPVLRVVLYHTPAGDRLLIVVHHLVIDAVSWTILLDDLQAIDAQLRAGLPPESLPRSVSYRQWSGHLRRFTQKGMPAVEVAHWLAAAQTAPATIFPVPDHASLSESTTVAAVLSFDAGQTLGILQEVIPRTGADVQLVLLAMLARVLAGRAGERDVLIDIESHGRQQMDDGLSADRTVGWFTVLYPVGFAVRPGAGPLEVLLDAKASMASVPGHGRGFGLLRTWSPSEEVRATLAGMPVPQVLFNYLGRTAAGDPGDTSDAERMKGEERSGRNRRTHILEVSARITGDCLSVLWNYAGGVLTAETVRGIMDEYAETLRELCAEVRRKGLDEEMVARDFGWQEKDVRAIAAQLTRTRRGDDDDDA